MKNKIILSVVGVILSLSLLIASTILVENEMISPLLSVVLIIISTSLVFVAIFYAAKIEHESYLYECPKCGHIFKPTFKAYILGAHMLTTRHLKCPKCEEKSWCRIKKEG